MHSDITVNVTVECTNCANGYEFLEDGATCASCSSECIDCTFTAQQAHCSTCFEAS